MQDMILALCVLAGSAVYLRAAIDLPKLQFGDPLGPQAFPCLIAFGLAISGVMLIIQTLSRKPVDAAAEELPVRRSRSEYALLAGLAVWTAIYYASFEPVGYILSTVIYLFVLLCVFQYGRWFLNFAYACAFTAAAYLVFGQFLHVVLPAGVLSI